MKKTILIDVDDVICENHVFWLVNKFLETLGKDAIKDLNDLTEYEFEKQIFSTQEELNAFNDFYAKHNSYENIKPIKDSVSALKKLNETIAVPSMA